MGKGNWIEYETDANKKAPLERKIKSVEKGFGEQAIFFSTHPKVIESLRVDEIKEETKVIGQGYYNDLTIIVYKGYKNGNLLFEMMGAMDVTVVFDIDS